MNAQMIQQIKYTNEKFLDTLNEKEFKELEITEEQYTIDNLLGVIEKLNKKIEDLTEDYNNLVYDCYNAMQDVDDIIYTYEFREQIGLE